MLLVIFILHKRSGVYAIYTTGVREYPYGTEKNLEEILADALQKQAFNYSAEATTVTLGPGM